MGVINNDEMKDRVQVILVITGLGAPTLEETVSQFSGVDIKPQTTAMPIPEPILPVEKSIQHDEPVQKVKQSMPYKSSPTNLDIPAFLRRRSGNNGLFER